MIGTRIAHYEITAKIGEGGMGEVYRASDTKLNREVALKILPEQFADSQRMGRFQREAEVLASLDHPNIGAIHGIEEVAGTKVLVLQLIEGLTLDERIARGPLSLEEALEIAIQIAKALEAAHEKGIVHRDLKPANVKLTPEGLVKVLDFGLAKVRAPDRDSLQRNTETLLSTQPGTLLGTAAYMSPEQVRGEAVDKRADIWAFGCVLYELLTGSRAYPARTTGEILAAVLESEPDWELLPAGPGTPVNRLLRRCLNKQVHQRLQHIGDARIEILDALTTPAPAEASVVRGRVSPPLVWVALGAFLSGVGFVAWNSFATRPPPSAPAAFSIDYPGGILADGEFPRISPDGTLFAMSGYDRLFVRPVGEFEWSAVAGTEGALSWPSEAIFHVFFSPDSRWVGYFGRGALWKVRTTGGGAPEQVSATAGFFAGASWGRGDTIVIGRPNQSLMRVPAAGGQMRELTRVKTEDGERNHRWPQVLPDGKNAVFTIGTVDGPFIGVASLDSGGHQRLFPGWSPSYLESGYLTYAQLNDIMIVPFDLETLSPAGPPQVAVEGVLSATWGEVPRAQYATSTSGSLAYVPGDRQISLRGGRLVLVDRNGQRTALTKVHNDPLYPRFSRDGKRVSVSLQGADRSIWLFDVDTGRPTILALEGDQFVAQWSRDGQRITFNSTHQGQGGQGIYEREVEGSGEVKMLSPARGLFQIPDDWSQDGSVLAFTRLSPNTSSDIWMLPPNTDEPSPFGDTANKRAPVFSSSGLIAYVSDKSGQIEVYVETYPESGGSHTASVGGGSEPVWGPNGRELFYRRGDDLFVVDVVATKPRIELGKPRSLFSGAYFRTRVGLANYDISPDGTRFVMVEKAGDTVPRRANVVLNWFEALKPSVPLAR